MNKEKGSVGLVVLLIAAVAGTLASGLVTVNTKAEIKVDKQVVAERELVDYSIMNE
jgi:Na+-translocating ferredoxin:NAD+ oxidoreductase RnfG subunit